MDSAERKDGWGNLLMPIIWRKPAQTLAEQTRRRVVVHLLPVLFGLYVLAYLDRVNVSVAQFGMTKPAAEQGLGFSNEVIGFGGGLFFWGYWILEIPSTLSVVRLGARWVFFRILILWGLCATLVGLIGLPFATTMFGWIPTMPISENAWLADAANYVNRLATDAESQFYFFRFALGFFEGGFFPSVIVYLTYWFRSEDRAKAIATFMAAIPISSIISLPISTALLQANWLGLAGWRWIFILEGIPPVLAGFAVLYCLPNNPSKAKWLTEDERNWLTAELDREQASKQGHGHFAWVHHLGMVLLLTAVYFCLNVGSYGLSIFLPAIIKSQSGLSDQASGYLSTLPYIVALTMMLANGWHSDRHGERIFHVAVPLTLLSLGIFLAALFDGYYAIPVLLMIFVVGACWYAHLPAFWPLPTVFLGSAAAASAIGFINMIGNLGGYYGPAIVGKASTGATSFAPALLKLAPWPLAAAVIVVIVGYARGMIGRRQTNLSAGPGEPIET